MRDKTMILGAELQAGHVIKPPNRIYKIRDIEAADRIGALLTDVEMTNGEFATISLFDDSTYELRSSPARPRPKIVKLALSPELAARVERNRLAGETTELAALRLVVHALNDWGG